MCIAVVRPLIAVGHQRLSIAARIEQFYRDVKQKSKELYAENEYDTRYIYILGHTMTSHIETSKT